MAELSRSRYALLYGPTAGRPLHIDLSVQVNTVYQEHISDP